MTTLHYCPRCMPDRCSCEADYVETLWSELCEQHGEQNVQDEPIDEIEIRDHDPIYCEHYFVFLVRSDAEPEDARGPGRAVRSESRPGWWEVAR